MKILFSELIFLLSALSLEDFKIFMTKIFHKIWEMEKNEYIIFPIQKKLVRIAEPGAVPGI